MPKFVIIKLIIYHVSKQYLLGAEICLDYPSNLISYVSSTVRHDVCPTYSRGRHKSEYKEKKSRLSDLHKNCVDCPFTKLDRRPDPNVCPT